MTTNQHILIYHQHERIVAIEHSHRTYYLLPRDTVEQFFPLSYWRLNPDKVQQEFDEHADELVAVAEVCVERGMFSSKESRNRPHDVNLLIEPEAFVTIAENDFGWRKVR